jgi:hypothetical protein
MHVCKQQTRNIGGGTTISHKRQTNMQIEQDHIMSALPQSKRTALKIPVWDAPTQQPLALCSTRIHPALHMKLHKTRLYS